MVRDEIGNRLLSELDSDDYSILGPHLVEVPLAQGILIAEAGETPSFLYFPTEGVLSLLGITDDGATLEVAVAGREAMAAISAALGGRANRFRVIAKIPGKALRLPTDLVVSELRRCGSLHNRLLTYADTFIAQISQSAVCNRYHNAKQRLAKSLLMTAERAGDATLPLTHEFISSLVGGPRSAVTEASSALRRSGAIEYSRGMLSIRSLDRLREESCECYEALLTEGPGASTPARRDASASETPQ